jgi:hypothetical protein
LRTARRHRCRQRDDRDGRDALSHA